jgi:hypothetical protein
MEISSTKSVKCNLSRVYRACLLLFLFILSSVESMFAQDLKNVKHSLSSIQAEQEKIAHDEFMSYVYMVVGFSIVIAIAWISTVKARKRSKVENEAKLKFIQQNLAKKAHGHGHGHAHGHAHTHSLHKARR